MIRSTIVAFLAVFLSTTTNAFLGVPHPSGASHRRSKLAAEFDKKGRHITYNPMDAEGYQGVDVERARACAENVGLCTVEEMEMLHSNLHKERLQNFASGGTGMVNPQEDALEHVLLEEELALQLDLIKEHTPDPSLFPEDEDEMAALPHLKDTTESSANEFFHKPTPSEVLELEETVIEENLLEPVLMCMVIAGLALAPQLLNL